MGYKVLQVGKFFSLKGGIETVTQSLVDTLQDEYTVDVLCFSEDSRTYKSKVASSTVWECGRLFSLLSSPISFQFFNYFRQLRNNYDIVLIHTPNPLAAIALLLFKTKAKVVVQWHGDILNKGLFYFGFKFFEKKMLNRADLVLATSSIYIEHSPALSRVNHKVKVLPLGINEKNMISSPDIVKEIKAKYNNRKIVFSLGRFVYYKGFEYLIEAAKYLNDDFVILIGGYGPQKNFYEQKIEELKFQQKVFLIPELNHGTWGNYYEACDVFCLPSFEKAESFGIVLLEAMSFSKPIVTTNIPGSGTPWVNQNDISGLNVPIRNSRELARAIETIVYSERYQDFCLNSRQRFDENFTERRMVSNLTKYFDEILMRKKNLQATVSLSSTKELL